MVGSDDGQEGTSALNRAAARGGSVLRLLPAVGILLVTLIPAIAFADETSSTADIPVGILEDSLDYQGVVEGQLTDSQAAEELPHQDLERAEAILLTEQVFGSQLESPAGLFDDMHVEKFLSDHAAVTEAGANSEASGIVIGGGASAANETASEEESVLLQSILPLRVEGDKGNKETVDLGLE